MRIPDFDRKRDFCRSANAVCSGRHHISLCENVDALIDLAPPTLKRLESAWSGERRIYGVVFKIRRKWKRRTASRAFVRVSVACAWNAKEASRTARICAEQRRVVSLANGATDG